MRASGAAGLDNQRPRWRYFRAEGGPAARVPSSADGAVSPTKWTDSLPATAFGVMTQVPPQEARATFPAVFESAMYVNPLPIAPRIQKLAFTGAYTSVPKTLPAVCAASLPSSPRAAIGIPSRATTRPIVSMPFMASSLPYDPVHPPCASPVVSGMIEARESHIAELRIVDYPSAQHDRNGLGGRTEGTQLRRDGSVPPPAALESSP